MATIEERAIAYRDDVRNGKHGINNTITDAYYVGATEQHKIDTEKACNAFCANCEVGQELCKSQNISCPEYKDFKKAMEE